MHDLLISGGDVVDGTGAPPARADVAVADGRIVAIGPEGTVGEAAERIDATGHVVTPGFIDPHTHLDAQLWWDPSGAPSVLHGVTTVITSSCGFGLAPCRPEGREYALRSFESAEEVPYLVTSRAVPFDWTTWPEFFAALGGLDLGVNVGALVPHSPLRVEADADVPTQVGLLREALAAGALGFSTSHGSNHTDGNGQPVPSRYADLDELASLVAPCEGRVWQINIAAKGATDPAGAEAAVAEIEGYAAISRRAGARQSWTPLIAAAGDTGAWRRLLDHNHELNRQAVVAPQVAAQPMLVSVCFDGPTFAAMIDGWAEAWAGYADLDDGDRRSRLADATFRRALRDAPTDCTRITSPCFERWVVAASPSRPDAADRTLAELADGDGVHPVDLLCDLAIADELATLVTIPMANLDADAAAALVADPSTMVGLGDAGAHIRSIASYSYPTHVLANLVRDRGALTLGDAVHRLSAHPAAVMGVPHRGVLASGRPADVCVIDLDRLALTPAEVVHDLPGRVGRLVRRSTGYRSVVVNGVPAVQDDVLTGRRAGQLVRAS